MTNPNDRPTVWVASHLSHEDIEHNVWRQAFTTLDEAKAVVQICHNELLANNDSATSPDLNWGGDDDLHIAYCELIGGTTYAITRVFPPA